MLDVPAKEGPGSGIFLIHKDCRTYLLKFLAVRSPEMQTVWVYDTEVFQVAG